MDIQFYHMQLVNMLNNYVFFGPIKVPDNQTNIEALRKACLELQDDETSMPAIFHDHIRDICGIEFQMWLTLGGTWAAAARVIDYYMNNHEIGENGKPRLIQARWVRHAMNIQLSQRPTSNACSA